VLGLVRPDAGTIRVLGLPPGDPAGLGRIGAMGDTAFYPSPGACHCPGLSDYAVLVRRTKRTGGKAGEEVLRCAYPGCENEPRPGEAGAASQECCGLPDPVTADPHLALTGFRWR
jgi:hypothetical protein